MQSIGPDEVTPQVHGAAGRQTLTAAEGIVDALLQCGVDTMFGIGGTHTLRLLGALEKRRDLRFVSTRTELGAAYMATGYARATGRPATVLTSTGPGALSVVPALEDAKWSNQPMIHLTTNISSGGRFSGAVHETPSQDEILAAASKKLMQASGDQAARSVVTAVQAACSPLAGPVTLQVPVGSWDDESELPSEGSLLAVADSETPPLSADEDLIERIRASKRPLLFVGGGVMQASKRSTVMELAHALGSPVVTSYQGKAIANWNDPVYVGPWATEAEVKTLCSQADFGLVLGSKLSALGTSQWSLPLPKDTAWVAGGRDQHPCYPDLQGIGGDAVQFASSVCGELGQARPPWFDCSALRSRVLAQAVERGPGEMAFVDAVAGGTVELFAADMSKASFWCMKYLPAAEGSVHAFSSYMAMGTALPIAIGMAVGTGRPVLALVGDGALQMSLAELGTVAEHALPITLLVVVDHAYGILRDNCAAVGGSAHLGVDLWNPEWRAVLSGFGFEVNETSEPGEVSEILRSEIDRPRAVLMHQRFSRLW